MSNFLKDYAENRSRMVGFPGYTPLGQKVEVPKLKKKDSNAYAKDYYEKHKEEICRRARENYASKKKKSVVIKTKEVTKNEAEVIKLKGKIAELEQEIKRLKKQISDKDEDIMSYKSAVISNLENKNFEKQVEIDEMKHVIKFLFKYFK